MLGVTRCLIVKATELKEVEMVGLVVAKGLFKVETGFEMRPLMVRPSTNGLLLHNHNTLY